MRKLDFVIWIFLMAFISMSCDKDDPVIPVESELITTLIYRLTPDGGGDPVVLEFQDLDGVGGNDPVFNVEPLRKNTTYTGKITLLNESTNPVDDITLEVREEDEIHQFFFDFDIPGLSIEYADMDQNGNPLGLKTVLTTSDPGSGTLSIVLRHEPDKSADGVADGKIINAGGETDIQVNFNIDVQ